MTASLDTAATIEIVAEPSPFFLFARLVKVSFDIDGALARLRWGTHSFAVSAGKHIVSVGVGYSFGSKATLEISAVHSEVVRLRYTPRLIKNLRGTLVIERLPAMHVLSR